MVVDGVFQAREASIVKEGWLQRHVSQWRGSELVTIGRIPRDLLESEVLILMRTIKDDVALAHAKLRSDLRHTNDVHLEIAEHFVRASTDGMTAYASGLSEEEDGTLFLRNTHPPAFTACETIDRCIREHQRKLEFRDGSSEHRKINPGSGCDSREHLPEQRSIRRRSIEPFQHALTDWLISRSSLIGSRHNRALPIIKLIKQGADRAGCAGEAGCFDKFRRRQMTLRRQQGLNRRVVR